MTNNTIKKTMTLNKTEKNDKKEIRRISDPERGDSINFLRKKRLKDLFLMRTYCGRKNFKRPTKNG
jgi:hypothetical protein